MHHILSKVFVSRHVLSKPSPEVLFCLITFMFEATLSYTSIISTTCFYIRHREDSRRHIPLQKTLGKSGKESRYFSSNCASSPATLQKSEKVLLSVVLFPKSG